MKIWITTALFSFLTVSSSFAQVPAVDANKSWARQIVYRELDRIDSFFVSHQKKSESEITDLIRSEDLRLSFFRVQIIARVMGKKGGPFLEKQGKKFKSVEDLIGRLDLHRSLKKVSAKLNEPKLIKHFEDLMKDSQKELVNLLESQGLWSHSTETITELKKDLKEKVDWLDGSKEKSFLVGQYADYAKEMHDLVQENKFDSDDIEKGLHELRRRLRWILIETAALEDFVSYRSDEKISLMAQDWFRELQTKNPQILEGKYLSLRKAAVPSPLLVPQTKVAILSEVVSLIGDLKDTSEMQIEIGKALQSLHLGEQEENRIFNNLNELLKSPIINHRALSRDLQKRLADSSLLKDLAKDLKNWN